MYYKTNIISIQDHVPAAFKVFYATYNDELCSHCRKKMSRKDHKVVPGAGGWRSIFSRGRTHSLKGAGYKPPPGTFQQYHSAQGMIDVSALQDNLKTW